MPRNRITCLAIFPLMYASSAEAGMSASSSMVDIHIACIKEGIASGEASLQTGNWIKFTCHGATAEIFFEKLGQYGFECTDVKTELGKVHTRAFDPPDMCWHKAQNPDGSAANEYACDLNFHGSSLLGK